MPDRRDRISQLRRSGANGSTGRDGASEDAGADAPLTELLQTLGSLPEVDRYRVEAIRQSLARGDYRIDTGIVARKLIDFEKAFATA
jgi:flagellar biosynthesis anti-sigma factor FlgM